MNRDPADARIGGLKVVGKRLARVDAKERVTGQAIYPADLSLPGMVHAKILRSPLAHARIRGIDTTRAQAMKGVLAVVTAADFPAVPVGSTIPMGETGYDMWMVAAINMARDKVHWIGQPVAAVAAIDVHTAAAALALIDIEYEPLEPVLGIFAAMASEAPVLHEHVFTKGVEPRPRAPSNVCSRVVISRGDASAALADAHASARVRVTVDTAHQGYLEPQVAVAQVDANGFATVWASTQGQFTAELMIARMLGLPASKLKVVPLEIGGGFGGKIAIHGEAVAVRLAQKCRRPVKLVLTREEVLQGGSGPVNMQMGQDDFFDVAWPDAKPAQLRPYFLFTLKFKRDFPSHVGMQRFARFKQMCPLAGIDHDDTVRMVDDPRINRQPLGPVPVGKDGELARQSVPAAFDLRGFCSDEAGLDGVNLHRFNEWTL